MIEFWKAIPGYEGIYEVSDLGRVKSLGNNESRKEKILKFSNNRKGYCKLNLFKHANSKTYQAHQLVAMAFLNHIPSKSKNVVDHINNIKTDNRLENLQIITQRENTSKDKKNKTSKYTGVYWCKNKNKWRSTIYISNKQIHLGYFKDEYKAHLAYEKALNEMTKGK